MALTSLDIFVLIVVAGAALLGLKRGFVYEVLALFAWVAVVFAIKLFHLPLSRVLAGTVGTPAGGATLAFALLAGGTWFGGRLVANAIGNRTKSSVLGPVDRALGFGFGALKGLIIASLLFLLMTLLFDFVGGGPRGRPAWMRDSRTYPLLNATSAGIADFVDRRRKGQPVFGKRKAEPVENTTEPAE
ncbi:CvpA family protein [Sphingomonas lenta]|uniref:Colicin V production protein n=1 Tax=Sphingomonas lenta TaxID=1141887 RepID=A0A2A2SH24_9SPHN|nr:CvpA family protein [Sphingomonas lenta]PAX08515.1 colicin V production protein [Sphingomonas lenta]